MSGIDLAALGLIVLMAFVGARRGLVAGLLSLAAVVVGAIAGSRIAPHLLSGGSRSPYNPLAGVVGRPVARLSPRVVPGGRGGRAPRRASAARPSVRSTRSAACSSVG